MSSNKFNLAALCSIIVAATLSGCTPVNYRIQADSDAYNAIEEKNSDERWKADDYSVEIDSRSRYHDIYDPDKPPIPQDDPSAHQLMASVNGIPGWEHWHDFGDRSENENPKWRELLSEYTETSEDGKVILDMESALQIAYIHSPTYQRQMETLFLSALDVSTERFRFDTQYFGGYDVRYNHNGRLIPAGFGVNPANGQLFDTAPFEGSEMNRMTVGRPSAGNPALQARKRLATAGQLVAGFANSFVFEFTKDDANLASSLINFSLVQPLLRGAGKDIALEQLTYSERSLLANVRAHSQYRQGFYTNVIIGDLGVEGPSRGGKSTFLSGHFGQASVGGFLGLLQQKQQIQNAKDNLQNQSRSLAELVARYEAGVIGLFQVDQVRQELEGARASLQQMELRYQIQLDNFKINTLGLPPDLELEIDDSFINPIQFIPRDALQIQDAIFSMRDEIGLLPDDVDTETLSLYAKKFQQLLPLMREQLESIDVDVEVMEAAVPNRETRMTEEEIADFSTEREQLKFTVSELQTQYTESSANLDAAIEQLPELDSDAGVRELVVWLNDTLQFAQRSLLVRARARAEAVVFEEIELAADFAYRIALDNRLDVMNAKAALVDSWRMIQFRRDALQSVLNITASGDIKTAKNNPVDFQASTGSVRLGVEFDAPITRLEERNAYREAMINYQQNRRALIQSQDRIYKGLRGLSTHIQLLQRTLENYRRSVAIAIRQLDMTRSEIYRPVAPRQPGQPGAQLGPNTSRNLLDSYRLMQSSQNQFLSAWLNFYAAKMLLAREMGVMQLDEGGKWTAEPLPVDTTEADAQAALDRIKDEDNAWNDGLRSRLDVLSESATTLTEEARESARIAGGEKEGAAKDQRKGKKPKKTAAIPVNDVPTAPITR